MSESPRFSSSSGKSQTSTPQASRHTCELREDSCQQMAESQIKDGYDVCFTQQDSNTFILMAAAVNRRHIIDKTVSSGSGPGQGPDDSEDRFHSYQQQFSDSTVTAAGGLQHCSSPFSCLQEVCSPDSLTHSSSSEMPTSWDPNNGSIQVSRLMEPNISIPDFSRYLYPDVPAVPVEPSCFQSQSYPSYNSSSPLQQVSSRLYPANDQSDSSKYSLHSLSTQAQKESPTPSLFPKPIYSYSILIFMALKNSKTGSLPVSEIYSFMTEHFPYFKTAPDGWKNSVRHNLSLNKCFEKVENKNGNSSRKGCLWALNPAKVEKMQEELHKWRRKDPITVRRSMARPEDLDRLLGTRPNKFRSLLPYSNPALSSRPLPTYSTATSSSTPTQLGPIRRLQYSHIPPSTQQPCYLPPVAAHPSNSFAQYSPCGQQPGSLNSPTAGKMPTPYDAAQHCAGPKSMQDLLLEGDARYDIDMLNPSLIDLQLQGNLWEELQKDSLVSDSQVVTTTTLCTTSALQDPNIQASGLQATPPVSLTSEVAATGRCKVKYECDDTGYGHSFEQHGCLNGLNPVVYSGVESLAGYMTSCTSISLM